MHLLTRRRRSEADVELLGTVPHHIAIIMDGNGRWAERRGLPRYIGHRAGLDRIDEVLKTCLDYHVDYLTLYAFSTENWQRSAEEVQYLMRLFTDALAKRTEELQREGVRLRFLGRCDRLPADTIAAMERAELALAANTKITLALAIDYGARDEISRAVRRLAESAARGDLAPDSLGEPDLAAALDTAGLPDPDLVIRPGGEYRLSNFLLWQAAYAELWFTPTLWPDFGRAQVVEALRAYAARARRFGHAR